MKYVQNLWASRPKKTRREERFLEQAGWKVEIGSTLLCGIIMLHILLIFDFFPYLHALLGTTRLLILLKNSHLQIYLELIYDNN